VRGDHFTFARSSGYWDSPRPYLDTVTVKAVLDATQKVNTFLSGGADIAFFPSPSIQAAQLADQGFKPIGRATGNVGIIFNLSRAPFDDARVRRALGLAADLKDANAKATNGSAKVVTTYFTADSPYFDPDVVRKTNKLAEAQKLIDSYVAEKGGPVKGTFVLSSSIANWGLPVQQQWLRLRNVQIDVNQVTAAQAGQLGQARNFDLTCSALGFGCDTLNQQLRGAATTNIIGYANPAVDAQLTECLTSTSVAKQKAALDKITGSVFTDAVGVFTHRNLNSSFAAKRVRGFVLIDDPNYSYPDLTQAWLAKS
jgi:ABC-type transport system substrate-binding protein